MKDISLKIIKKYYLKKRKNIIRENNKIYYKRSFLNLL